MSGQNVSANRVAPTDYIQAADGIGLLTTTMFWSMIEMGIAAIAGCLPPMWPLITKIPLEDMARTVRRTLSLENLRSIRSTSTSQKRHDGAEKPGNLKENAVSLDNLPPNSEAVNDLVGKKSPYSAV
jgi:hypothetical protein